MLGHAHPHVASLPIERKPFHIVDTPPEVSVLLSANNLVLRSSEHIGTVGSARVSHSWGDVQISGNGVEEKSVVMTLTWINVFKENFGIPYSFIVFLPEIIQIRVFLEVQ